MKNNDLLSIDSRSDRARSRSTPAESVAQSLAGRFDLGAKGLEPLQPLRHLAAAQRLRADREQRAERASPAPSDASGVSTVLGDDDLDPVLLHALGAKDGRALSFNEMDNETDPHVVADSRVAETDGADADGSVSAREWVASRVAARRYGSGATAHVAATLPEQARYASGMAEVHARRGRAAARLQAGARAVLRRREAACLAATAAAATRIQAVFRANDARARAERMRAARLEDDTHAECAALRGAAMAVRADAAGRLQSRWRASCAGAPPPAERGALERQRAAGMVAAGAHRLAGRRAARMLREAEAAMLIQALARGNAARATALRRAADSNVARAAPAAARLIISAARARARRWAARCESGARRVQRRWRARLSERLSSRTVEARAAATIQRRWRRLVVESARLRADAARAAVGAAAAASATRKAGLERAAVRAATANVRAATEQIAATRVQAAARAWRARVGISRACALAGARGAALGRALRRWRSLAIARARERELAVSSLQARWRGNACRATLVRASAPPSALESSVCCSPPAPIPRVPSWNALETERARAAAVVQAQFRANQARAVCVRARARGTLTPSSSAMLGDALVRSSGILTKDGQSAGGVRRSQTDARPPSSTSWLGGCDSDDELERDGDAAEPVQAFLAALRVAAAARGRRCAWPQPFDERR